MGFFSNVSRGFQKAFSSPAESLKTVATGGLAPLIEQNPKGAASAAAGGLAGAATAGLPGLVGGAVLGAVKGGTDKRSILDSAAQTALIAGSAGAAYTFAGANLPALKSALAAGNKPAATAAISKAAPAASSKGFLSGFGSTLKDVGLVAALTRAGQQAGGFLGLLPTPASAAEQGYADARRDILAAANQRADTEGGDPAAVAGGASPAFLLLALAIPGGLLAWWLLRRKRK